MVNTKPLFVVLIILKIFFPILCMSADLEIFSLSVAPFSFKDLFAYLPLYNLTPPIVAQPFS